MKLAGHLLKHGYEGMVLSPSDGPLHAEYSQMGIPVIILNSILDDARVIVDYLNDHDILFANTILAYRTIHAAHAFQIQGLWWTHESNYGQNTPRYNPGVVQAFNTADAVIFPSVTSSSLYKDFSSQDNYYPIHIGINIEPPAKQSSYLFTKPKDGTFR